MNAAPVATIIDTAIITTPPTAMIGGKAFAVSSIINPATYKAMIMNAQYLI